MGSCPVGPVKPRDVSLTNASDVANISFLWDPEIVGYEWCFVSMLLVTLCRWRGARLLVMLRCLGLFPPVVLCCFLCNGLWRCHTLSLSCTSSSVMFLSGPLWSLWAVQPPCTHHCLVHQNPVVAACRIVFKYRNV